MRRARAATRDPRERYVAVLDHLCELGRLGRKSGRGYYAYSNDNGGGKQVRTTDAEVRAVIEQASTERGIARRHLAPDEIVRRALLAMVSEAALLLVEGVAQRAGDIDVVLVQGYGFPRWQGGPVFWARQWNRAALDTRAAAPGRSGRFRIRRGRLRAVARGFRRRVINRLFRTSGVSVFVILFVIVSIARPLFKEIDLSWHLFPGIYFFGVATFVMSMLPGTPQIQNIIPTKYLGTTAMAAPALGLIASVFVITANYFLLGWMIRRSKSKGEGYEGSDPAGAKAAATQDNSGDKALPNIWLALMPSVALLILLNVVKLDIFWALLGGIVAGMVLLNKHLTDKLKILTGGATNCALPVINTCADVGFGAVVGSVIGFKSISNMLLSIPGTPLISLSLATQLLCGITGSASGGLGIAMEFFAKQFLALGLNREEIHRIASQATGTSNRRNVRCSGPALSAWGSFRTAAPSSRSTAACPPLSPCSWAW